MTSSKCGKALGFVAEGLHHLLPVDHLVDQRGLLAADGALALERSRRLRFAMKARHAQGVSGVMHTTTSVMGTFSRSMNSRVPKMVRMPVEQLGKAHQQAVRKGVHIRHHAADDIAGGVAVQIGQRQGLNFAQRLVAQITR